MWANRNGIYTKKVEEEVDEINLMNKGKIKPIRKFFQQWKGFPYFLKEK